MFQRQPVARHQCRGGGAKYLPERKVPRHHGQHHTERVIRDIAVSRIRFHRLGTQEIFQRGEFIPAGTLILSGGITEALAVLAGDNVTLRVQGMGSTSSRFV